MPHHTQDRERQIALDALKDAGVLYERYLQLSGVADFTVSGTEHPSGWDGRVWDQPLGVVIRPGGEDAIVE